jgi:RHS repeat-associated protein
MHYYHCDHLGTPTEMTDCDGNMSWAAKHKAWGAAKVAISDAAEKAGIKNPFRFQGQYFDEETGLHYNRYRYYDPHSGRFVSKDPIGLAGGTNSHAYAPNPLQWVDPLGLTSKGGCYGTFYRGDSRGGVSWMRSHGARSSGYLSAVQQTERLNQDGVMKQHAFDSVTPASPYISVTTDPKVAEFFATNGGSTTGTVYTLKIKCGRAKQNKFNRMMVPAGTGGKMTSEAEWLVPAYIKPSEVVGKRTAP